MLLRFVATVISGVCLSAFPAAGHEFWLSPDRPQVEVGTEIQADFRNGERFRGATYPFFPGQSERFDVIVNGETRVYLGNAGDYPAFRMQADEPGLWVLVHQTAPSRITYPQWKNFEKFTTHKDFPQARDQHIARGLPASGFSELYTRYVKALVGVGNAKGADGRTGLETEFVALTNPYTDDLTQGVSVGLLYENLPRPDAQVEVFDRAPDGQVTITLHRTDQLGQVVIPVSAGHDYLLDAVVLRPADDDDAAVWETLWAALTFSTPVQ
ncbi:DUF4198 domain-containing protein [Falsiphaeobacter marinintestinus]|uniref:DUF4198 domain-containing protein n=1 Tax=Falsiphaeobacter marinintestinus TaxID=1492905 RepID=UPI0011B7240C|nr:DUF4198 domain-containing protein [Phaeobacter marinintestinus]